MLPDAAFSQVADTRCLSFVTGGTRRWPKLECSRPCGEAADVLALGAPQDRSAVVSEGHSTPRLAARGLAPVRSGECTRVGARIRLHWRAPLPTEKLLCSRAGIWGRPECRSSGTARAGGAR